MARDMENDKIQYPSSQATYYTDTFTHEISNESLEYFGLDVLSHDFPVYPGPYQYPSEDRNFPSPGHLAHALNLIPPEYPWCPRDSSGLQICSRGRDVRKSQQ
jgi:hypothetical protein